VGQSDSHMSHRKTMWQSCGTAHWVMQWRINHCMMQKHCPRSQGGCIGASHVAVKQCSVFVRSSEKLLTSGMPACTKGHSLFASLCLAAGAAAADMAADVAGASKKSACSPSSVNFAAGKVVRWSVLGDSASSATNNQISLIDV